MSDLEDELRKLQPANPPAAWRRDILARCASAVQAESEVTSTGWRAWLWPSPLAWGALAAVWFVLGIIDVASPQAPLAEHRTAENQSNILAARRENQALLAQLR
jgi:hypothetical protein